MLNQLCGINKKSTLLVMDFQEIILNNYLSRDDANKVIQHTRSLISSARMVGIPVIYVSVGFRKDYPEVSKNNTVFSAVKENGAFKIGSESTAIHADIAPQNDEIVIIKHRIGAFSFTDLEIILRSQDIETLILTGINTSGTVLSTVRQAFDLDYRLVVAKDCCADPDHDINQFLLEKFFLSMHMLPLHPRSKKSGPRLFANVSV